MKELDNKIIDLLIQPKNLETAYDVCEQMPAVQDKLATKFWDALEEQVRAKIDNPQFEIVRDGEPTQAEALITISEKCSKDSSLQCSFRVQQEGGRLPIYFGVGWEREVSREEFAILMSDAAIKPILSEFLSSLEKAGFKRTSWYIGYK
jgi:hypothetical protein